MKRVLLTVIAVFFVICVGIGIAMSLTMDKVVKPSICNYVNVSNDEGKQIESVFKECGIEKFNSFEHDEMLDDEGISGYRMATSNVKNIIVYLKDNRVHQIRYSDHDLYSNGTVIDTLQDYTISKDEVNKYQILCQEKVKEILTSPSTAKFPNYTEWGFHQEKNIFTVQGYVDAQNALGGTLRSNFQFLIDSSSDKIQSFIFDGKELIK